MFVSASRNTFDASRSLTHNKTNKPFRGDYYGGMATGELFDLNALLKVKS